MFQYTDILQQFSQLFLYALELKMDLHLLIQVIQWVTANCTWRQRDERIKISHSGAEKKGECIIFHLLI